MNRRHLIRAATAMAASAPAIALAQQAGQSTSDSAAAMGPAEQQHIFDTLATGAVALETSKIALQKAQNPWVKKFAQYEVAEQEIMAEVLKPEPVATGSSKGKAEKNPDKKSDMVEDLKAAKSGPEFDQAYIKGQTEGHLELLQIQEAYISRGRDKAHVNMAKLARGQIKEHIDLLQTIQREMKG